MYSITPFPCPFLAKPLLMGVGNGGQGVGHALPPWIFIHGTDLVDRG